MDGYFRRRAYRVSLIIIASRLMNQKILLGIATVFFSSNLIADDFYTREIGGRENGKVRLFREIPGSSNTNWVREYSLISMGKNGLEVYPHTLIIDCRLRTLEYGENRPFVHLDQAKEALSAGVRLLNQAEINSVIGPACKS